ncbi:protein bli-3 [Diplodia corticola]|uniref:Protein bli-3 n=1 Tax=Diplodia corticola TaxID=236234 RepID=A0A1J9RW29_9PEZI|nr:protein bli-3 [Diplodia corticola]OJD36827.1 protein bli-3 [Diplodia corticola]
MTGRTWLVDVGDANELQDLSPASLSEGYAAVDVALHAPKCLTGSVSAPSMEPFQHVMASCGFTSTTQHTGRADRPWEYREGLKSMVALDFETAGYDLTRGSIEYGDYFDKDCFCHAFSVDTEKEPCGAPGHLEWTQEQLWIHVTCGPTSPPSNWTNSLKVTGFRYIPIEDWHWPPRVMDLPSQVAGLVHHCATDACGLDSSGYCKVKRTVDRTCTCRSIDFATCGSACHTFETRIAYVKWLHNLCGQVQDWHGLPDDWRQLAAPTTLDMIPWKWSIRSSNDRGKRTSDQWTLRSFVFVNVATLLAALYYREAGIHPSSARFPRLRRLPYHSSWLSTGISIAALHLLANWVNAVLIQRTPGYEDTPVTQLVFFWCSMPRPAWLIFLLIGLQPFHAINFFAAKSSLFAEIILQALSAYYMLITVNYGRQHNFYLGGLEGAKGSQSAGFMYAGALLWLVVTAVALALSILATCRMTSDDGDCVWLGKGLENYWMHKSNRREGDRATMYGTLHVQGQHILDFPKRLAELYALLAMSALLLWLAQWVFWSGFLGFGSEQYVFKHRIWSCS